MNRNKLQLIYNANSSGNVLYPFFLHPTNYIYAFELDDFPHCFIDKKGNQVHTFYTGIHLSYQQAAM